MYATHAPYPQFTDNNGRPLEAGYIYYGVAGKNPETDPITVYWDKAGSQPAAQPVRTSNGYAVRAGTPADIYAQTDYSISVKDKNNNLIYYKGSAVENTGQYLPAINVKDSAFGAVGNGVADDTLSIQAAINAAASAGGGLVYLPSGAYKVTSGLVINTGGVTIIGQQLKASTVVPVGNFNAITITGGAQGCTIENLTFDAALATGGSLFNVSNADRTFIKNIIALNPYCVSYAERFNLLTFENIWANGCRGDYMFMLHGTPALRSDVCVFNNVTGSADTSITPANRSIGLIWEGNVHTVTTNGLRFVTPYQGILIRNAGGGTYPAQCPAFLQSDDLEIDFPYAEGVRIESGYSIWLSNPYLCNSSTAQGLYVASGCYVGGLSNGKICGNYQEGIAVGGTDWNFSNTHVALNSWTSGNLGNYAGVHVLGTAKRINFSGVHSGNEEGSGATHTYGLLVDVGASNIEWSGGYLGGNLFEPWRDESAGGNDNFEVTASGSLLSIIDNVMMGTSDGYRAKAIPSISGGVITSVVVSDGGACYGQSPQVFAFDPAGTGSGAILAATVSNGVVTGVTVTNGGVNYSANTKIYFRPLNTEPTIRPYSAASSGVNLRMRAKGTSNVVNIGNDSGNGLQVWTPPNSVNFMMFKGNISGAAPELYAAGTDTDIDFKITPKGAGRIQLGAQFNAAADAPIVGYFEVRDTSGNIRKIACVS